MKELNSLKNKRRRETSCRARAGSQTAEFGVSPHSGSSLGLKWHKVQLLEPVHLHHHHDAISGVVVVAINEPAAIVTRFSCCSAAVCLICLFISELTL